VICILLGLSLSLCALISRWKPGIRAFFFCLGQTILLTAPLAGHLQPDLFGAFPTVDKSGSIAFYLDGIHKRVLLHPIASLSDPGARLIGVHACHLWITEFFDLFLSTAGAFNIQGILYPALGWWASAALARRFDTDWPTAIALGFAFGMGLHVFADLNWYTIEKAAVFTVPLYAYCLVRATNPQPISPWWVAGAWVLCVLINLYFALVTAIGTVLFLLAVPSRKALQACVATALAGLPLVIYQWALMRAGPQPADADAYLHLRAAQDVLNLETLTWNRLELWRSINPVLPIAAAIGAARSLSKTTTQRMIGLFLVFTYLSLGPFISPGVPNPGWQELQSALPGLWRLSEPEVFFQGSVLTLIALGAAGLGRGRRIWLYPVCALLWLSLVRTHAAYPGFSEFHPPKLSPSWQQQEKTQHSWRTSDTVSSQRTESPRDQASSHFASM